MVRPVLAGLVAVVFAFGTTTAVHAQTPAPNAEEEKPADTMEKKTDKKPAAKKEAKSDKKPAAAKAPAAATAEKKDEKPAEAKK